MGAILTELGTAGARRWDSLIPDLCDGCALKRGADDDAENEEIGTAEILELVEYERAILVDNTEAREKQER